MPSDRPILFLDVDGVLNGHFFMREAQSCNIRRPCVVQFNRVIRRTGCRVVLSSAWRYMIHGGAMTLSGFAYMLRTHGATGSTEWLVGATEPDETCPACGDPNRNRRGNHTNGFNENGCRVCRKCGAESTRGGQIAAWLAKHGTPDRYAVVDDDDLGITAAGHPFVQTGGRRGLTKGKADALIRLLSPSSAARAGSRST